MKLSCEKILLEHAIAIAGRAVSSKSSIPVLEGLLLRADDEELTVTGYDLQTGIRVKIPVDIAEPGQIVLNAKLLDNILRRMPEDIVTLTVHKNLRTNLRCGDTDFDISGLAAADYPALPEVRPEHSISLRRKTLRAMILETSFAISTNATRPALTGALFEISENLLTMVAVDGYRLAIRRTPLNDYAGAEFSFIAPGPVLGEVRMICGDSEEPLEVSLGQRHIVFVMGDIEIISRRLEGDFLDYRGIIPQSNAITTAVTVGTKALTESIERVSVVISGREQTYVRCQFGSNQVLLSARTSVGEAKDLCQMDGDGAGLEIGFNGRYLKEALRYAPADMVRIELNTENAPALIVPADGGNNFLYMVLPVRLKRTAGEEV